MKLEDQEKIHSIQSFTLPEVETAYWKMEDYLSSGNKKKATVYFDMLCYAAKYRKNDLSKILKPSHMNRLKKVSYELSGKRVPETKRSVNELPAYLPVKLPFKLEKDIGDYLCSHENMLKSVLNSEGRITGREVDVEGYKCDLVFEDKNTFFAIEIKRDQADHKAISQLDKYCHYFYLKLRYSMYKEVCGICIANGFCKYSVNEFRRRDRRIFYISSDGKNCELKEIK